MNTVLSWVLGVARRLPRGDARLLGWLSRRFQALHEWEISLVMVPGTLLVADLRESVFFPLWKHGCYPHQLAEDRLARRFLRRGDCVWDVGANVGYTAVLYRHFVGDSGLVVAFEPSPRAYQLLVRNVRRWSNVLPLQVAVSDRQAWLPFDEKANLDTSSVLGADKAVDGSMLVPSITLDGELTRRRPPDFLKIDVEGHEPAVLRGAAEVIRRHHPLIQFEALDETSLRQVLVVLEEIAGADYDVLQVKRDGSLTSALSMGGEGCTFNFLAAGAGHIARLAEVRSRSLACAAG
jgi:FkbM family methyltransferase